MLRFCLCLLSLRGCYGCFYLSSKPITLNKTYQFIIQSRHRCHLKVSDVHKISIYAPQINILHKNMLCRTYWTRNELIYGRNKNESKSLCQNTREMRQIISKV